MSILRSILIILVGLTSAFSAVFTVSNTQDSGEGSLRWALDQVNTHSGPDTIFFNIPDSSPGFNNNVWTIALQSALPSLTDAGTYLNGATQRNTNADGPEVIIDGRSAGTMVNGLVIASADNTIRGLGIINFTDNGILINSTAAKANRIFSCYIGVGSDGKTGKANAGHGVYLNTAGFKNVIGSSRPEYRNVISANLKNGIQIEKTDSTIVIGNYIGCDATGKGKLGNQQNGIYLFVTTQHTRIGGDAIEEGNVIAANLWHGILMQGNLVKYCIIRQNRIGTDENGSLELGNERYGIYLYGGASDNTIGPNNNIMNNKKYGIGIASGTTLRNRITRNAISSNTNTAIQLTSGANSGIAAPSGIKVTNEGVSGLAAANSVVEIFSDPVEEGAWFEASVTSDANGRFFWAGKPKGPSITANQTDGLGNTSELSSPLRIVPFIVTTTLDSLEGSLRWAIEGSNVTPDADKILFNIPLTDPGYKPAKGIWLIRPNKPLPFFNNGYVEVDGSSQTKNQGNTNPQGPEIYLDGLLAGDKAKGLEIHSGHNWIHDLGIGSFSQNAIAIIGEASKHNRITGCYIGLDADGKSVMPRNGWNGVVIATADSNLIGGPELGQRNYIAGMGLHGIFLSGSPCRGNVIVNNYVGLDVSGMQALPNAKDGIRLEKGPKRNVIGGSNSTERNISSGNGRTGIRLEGAGVDSNQVAGNWIGLTAAGTDSLPNAESGIVLADHVTHNTIGGSSQSAGNVISGNRYSGVQIRVNSDYNTLSNNTIGLDPSHNKAFGNNQHGVYIYSAAANNTIGPGNVIAANGRAGAVTGMGILVDGTATKGNRILKNSIGTISDKKFGNSSHGVCVRKDAMDNMIGPENTIAYNDSDGVRIVGERSVYNTITRNSIYRNSGLGIELLQSANFDLAPPIFAPKGDGTVYGKAQPYATVEVFVSEDEEGRRWLGTATADENGKFSLNIGKKDSVLTATATDGLGNTSKFSRNNPTAVSTEEGPVLPQTFSLQQNYPNPFNAATVFTFSLPTPEWVSLSLYNVNGQKIARMLERSLPAGNHSLTWIAQDDQGQLLPSGTYYYVLKAGAYKNWKKMVLLK